MKFFLMFLYVLNFCEIYICLPFSGAIPLDSITHLGARQNTLGKKGSFQGCFFPLLQWHNNGIGSFLMGRRVFKDISDSEMLFEFGFLKKEGFCISGVM